MITAAAGAGEDAGDSRRFGLLATANDTDDDTDALRMLILLSAAVGSVKDDIEVDRGLTKMLWLLYGKLSSVSRMMRWGRD